ncbi:MAG TPA: polysulfide reductase, partial [Desulfofustis sp.]|nr:polysulfide reductase [Desulfofustis sp.]
IMFAYGVRHHHLPLIRAGALIAVAGIIVNRLNTAMVAYNWRLYQEIPRWSEIWLVLTVLCIYFMVYRFILYRLPVLYSTDR